MNNIRTPIKPFPTFKWRWLSVAPSEGLLKAPVFLGVLRALQQHEGERYSSIGLHHELQRVRTDTRTDIDLARTPDRNLFRNSGQYWRGTGLVVPNKREIQLTNLGKNIASGNITNAEFTALMIRNTVLPNPLTYSPAEIKKWSDANLRIKPLELILAVMDKLGREYDVSQSFISPNELIKVLIPLSGENAPVAYCAQAIYAFRNGQLDVSAWPNCVPAANDKRLAREFLLFLENFDVCQTTESADNYEQRFYIDQVLSEEIRPDLQRTFLENTELAEEEVNNSRYSEIPIIIERKRVATSVIRRTSQSRFRREVFAAGGNRCVLTQEQTPDVLEAAHIIPVGHGGSDLVGNGFCMRVDIHRLFDGGKIRIKADGTVQLNEQIENAVSYADLPRMVPLPQTTGLENVEWRSRYL